MLISEVKPAAIVPLREVAKKPIELYDYQKKLKSELYGHIRTGTQRILVVAPPGSGKTLLAADVLRDATERAKTIRRCVFLVDLNCLLDQTAEELSRLGLKCTVLQGKRGFDRNCNIIVASCQTLEARLKSGVSAREVLGNVSLLFNDEAHDTAYRKVYAQLQQEFLPSGAIFVGMTGTPWRMSRRQCMGDWYDALCIAPQPPELIKMGRLVICRPFTINDVLDSSQLDVSSTGDYIEAQMQRQATSEAALKVVVSNSLKPMASSRPLTGILPPV